jgi:5'-3' exonuclease
MREYLDLEFHDIEPVLPFDYSLERIIDDFILLAVFVGNDFLPHLPDLHIHENGLERLFEVYKKVLPSLGSSAQLHMSYLCLQILMSMICRRLHERGRKDSIEPAAGGSG